MAEHSAILPESRLAELRLDFESRQRWIPAIAKDGLDLLASHDTLMDLLKGFNLTGDCLVCTDSEAEHNSNTAGCPCCWTAPKHTLQEVMQWDYDNGRNRDDDLLRRTAEALVAVRRSWLMGEYATLNPDDLLAELRAAGVLA